MCVSRNLVDSLSEYITRHQRRIVFFLASSQDSPPQTSCVLPYVRTLTPRSVRQHALRGNEPSPSPPLPLPSPNSPSLPVLLRRHVKGAQAEHQLPLSLALECAFTLRLLHVLPHLHECLNLHICVSVCMCGCVWVPVAWTVRVRGCTYTTHTVAALRPLPSLRFPLFFSVFLFVGCFVFSPFLRSAFVSLPLLLKEQKHARDKPPRSPYSTHPTHHRADTRSWDMHAHSPPPLSANCARTDEGEKAHTHTHACTPPTQSTTRKTCSMFG